MSCNNKDVDVVRYFVSMVLVISTIFFSSAPGRAADFSTIQLVGNFNGISCEPDDPANNMAFMGDNHWQKLKFINEPGDPDTIYFKFTANNSYTPEHWGWSFVEGWGIADLTWNPPSIGAVLPDSGYWYFHFDDSTYAYWLDRPDASIAGVVHSSEPTGVPKGTKIHLFDNDNDLIGIYEDFSDSTFEFSPLPPSTFYLTASAPGFRDTTVTDIHPPEGGLELVTINLSPVTAVLISAAVVEEAGDGLLITWSTSCCDPTTGFDVYRGVTPRLDEMTRRNAEPVRSPVDEFRFFDICENRDVDYYYYIVEIGFDDPTYFGPILAAASLPSITSSLGQNYPNPFNPATTIPYFVSKSDENTKVTVAFFDVAGRAIARYDLGNRPSGNHRFDWNPSLSDGKSLPSGVYYCRLTIGKEIFTRKMIMLR